jgi:hypothetical protein
MISIDLVSSLTVLLLFVIYYVVVSFVPTKYIKKVSLATGYWPYIIQLILLLLISYYAFLDDRNIKNVFYSIQSLLFFIFLVLWKYRKC